MRDEGHIAQVDFPPEDITHQLGHVDLSLNYQVADTDCLVPKIAPSLITRVRFLLG